MAEHRDKITGLVASRTVQTNEVRRCTALLPSFEAVRDPERPLALVEVGASAGLNLLFDRYRYDYGTASTGAESSPLTLAGEIRSGQPPIPDPLPTVSWRLGIDLQPIDVADSDAVRWARALIWPEQVERFERFDAAIAIARRDPPAIREGDALDLLPAAIGEAPPDASLVVYHSFVLNQWTSTDRERFHELLAVTDRRIDRISMEMLVRGQRHAVVEHTRYEGGEATADRLGTAHHHGEWLRWAAGAA